MKRQNFDEQVVRLLETNGNMTAQQIILATGADPSNVYKSVMNGRRRNLIHIAEWARQNNPNNSHKHYTTVHAYGIGPGPDAPKPKPGTAYRNESGPKHHDRRDDVFVVPDAAARRAADEKITQSVVAAARAVLVRDPDNFFASMLGQMGAV